MRVLIISAAVLAFASAAPSGVLFGSHGYSLPRAAPLAVAHSSVISHSAPVIAHAAPVIAHAAIAPAIPTISSGDIQAAAIDAHVDAVDHTRAAIDQASEIYGQHINAAEDHSWQALDAVKTVEAQLDGAAAAASPVLAKSLVAPVAVAHAAPIVAHAAPVFAHAAPLSYAAAPVAHAAPVAYTAPVAVGHSQSISQQSLTQTHPSPAVAVSYAAAPVAHAAPLTYAASIAHAAPVAYSAPVAVGHSQSISQQSLTQTHPSPAVAVSYAAAPIAHHAVHAW